ncbi:3-deoxy-manno-octulosonate cytidylyltransferase [Rhodospirillaceae bacterium KN72]|uniref:3-deoxy-manno-octulosonate cytidylyltransferase n=1 Tax=Pacificispira spongiicola TaxID=2729598 RepID=A0A7Y0DZQ5_9PROT|nr:3-deoxy-manno-octulosonate cytidylyltransferase [Pacificispira spongiicola]NMM43831.1 3-deoxy-manno-octulosonate cytidylyltransferase [Pacificispira spongiicola]
MSLKPIVLIPSRLASTRLPNKPLADIHGKPMIVHCVERALEADLGPVIVAAGDQEIIDAVGATGHQAILTDPDHPSGSDRIHEALESLDPQGHYDTVINVQGDLPTLDPVAIRAVLAPLVREPEVGLSTIAAEIRVEEEKTNPNVVKLVAGFAPSAPDGGFRIARALTFTRATAPWGDGPLYHHIGLYAYRRDALRRFVALPPGILERRERLEQLRALEDGMRIDAALVDTVPLGVDTQEDLDRARTLLSGK